MKELEQDRCPNCNSTNTRYLETWGELDAFHKQYECRDCETMFTATFKCVEIS